MDSIHDRARCDISIGNIIHPLCKMIGKGRALQIFKFYGLFWIITDILIFSNWSLLDITSDECRLSNVFHRELSIILSHVSVTSNDR